MDKCETCRWWDEPFGGDLGLCTKIVDEPRGLFAERTGHCPHYEPRDK